jgi:hypothetical protein
LVGLNLNSSGSITTASTLSFYSPFTFAALGSVFNPLPIELLFFKAELVNNERVELKWSTATELNNDYYFTIEKTRDGKNYEIIGTIQGAGTSKQKQDYTFLDNFPYSGTSYYRLKQTDLDGKSKYSDISKVVFRGQFNFTVYPNPSHQQPLQIRIHGKPQRDVEVSLKDVTGKIQFVTRVTLKHENDIITVDPHAIGLILGIYIISTRSDVDVFYQKVIVN